MNPRTFTAEDVQRAQQARKALIEAGAHYRRDWLDADNWAFLAVQRGIRLPAWWVQPTPAALKRWFRKLGCEGVFAHVYGCSPSRLIELNPKAPLRAFVGQMLEGAK